MSAEFFAVSDERPRVAYLGSSASPHNRRWIQYLSSHVTLRVFSLESPAIPGIDICHLPRATGTGLDYLLARRHLLRELRAWQPDIVHAQRITSYGDLGRVAAAGLMPRPQLVVSVWGEDIFSFPRRSPLHAGFTRRVLRAADRILSTSHVMKRETERYIQPIPAITVTPFGVDLERFTVPEQDARSDQPLREVVVGTVKKLRERYGVHILLRAVAEARERLLPELELRCRIAGDGPQRAELERLARELGIEHAVQFLGRVPHEEVPAVLNSFDIFAALSITDDESFGVAMLEASACGLPVVSTRVGGIPEVVDHENSGILVAARDVAAAADAIVRLAQDGALRQRMGEAGRALVQERFDWATTAARVVQVYREVLAHGS